MIMIKRKPNDVVANRIYELVRLFKQNKCGDLTFLNGFETWVIYVLQYLPRWVFWGTINKGWHEMYDKNYMAYNK